MFYPRLPLEGGGPSPLSLSQLPPAGRSGCDSPCHRISALRPSPKFPCLSAAPLRRFPAPWTVEAIDAGFKVIDSNGQSFAYMYRHADKRDAEIVKRRTQPMT